MTSAWGAPAEAPDASGGEANPLRAGTGMRKAKLAARRKGLYADCLRTYLGVIGPSLQARTFDRVLLRTSSRRGVDLMSLAVSDGRLRYSDLLTHARSDGGSWQALCDMSRGKATPSAISRIARVVALQEQGPCDRDDALMLLRWLYTQCGPDTFGRDERRLFQNLAFVMGEYALADRLMGDFEFSQADILTMRADLANPWVPSPFSSHAAWQASFAELFQRHGIEAPIVNTQSSATGEPFDGLHCQLDEVQPEGPLVSVIVTCWQPGEELESALRSVLGQTWRNLEVLLVDDASPSGYDGILHRMQAMDPRIRLLRQPENGGTYLARNAALRSARGEFVTGQDSDDWSHPRRLEKQVAQMLRRPGLISTTSHALRCDPSMLFVAPGMLARRENASSLMFRRIPAIEQAGYYDSTRKGGDTEYELRLRQIFGENSHSVLGSDLALIRRSRQSLSHAEFRPGWRHPSRSAYRRAYEFWHHTEQSAEAFIIAGEMDGPRRFPIPSRFSPRLQAQKSRIDVVFADDFRLHAGIDHLRGVLDEINALRNAGLQVGITHIRSFRDVSFEAIDSYWEPIAKAIHKGNIQEVLLTDTVKVSTMIIRRPEIALFLSPIGTALRPDRVLVVAEEAVRQPEGKVWYEPRVCQRNLRDAFAAQATWSTGSKSVRRELRKILTESIEVTSGYPIVVDLYSWRYPARWRENIGPIVGFIASPRDSKFFRDILSLRSIFTEKSGIALRILGNKTAVLAILRRKRLPTNWTCIDESAGLETFLGGCGFVVQLGRGMPLFQEKRIALQALASGCVLIATPERNEVIEQAIGSEPGAMADLIQGLWRDESAYRNQIDEGLCWLRTKYEQRQQQSLLATILGKRIKKMRLLDCKEYEKVIENRPIKAPGASGIVKKYVSMYQSRGYAREIDRTILRTGSWEGRNILACIASRGGLNWSQIRAMLSDYRIGDQNDSTPDVFQELDARFTCRLGGVVALQSIHPDDSISALTLFKALIDAQGIDVLDSRHSQLALEIAVSLRDWEFLERHLYRLPVDEASLRFIELDIHNPFINSPFSDRTKWLQLLSKYYLSFGITPLELEAVEGSGTFPFDCLSTTPLIPVDTGDLVTVVISSWCPDESLIHAMRSITRQTWQNLEILLIDDASPEKFMPLLESVAAADSRIRLIRQPQNRGTYVARNRGMAEAKGRYFTVHDSDDWAHPQRIERQIRALQGDQNIVSTSSFAFRCNEQMIVNLPGISPERKNASSLTFDLERVKRRIGYFDESRKGADTEYQLRMRMMFGEDSHQVLHEPLAVIRLRADSLSRTDFKHGWRHPARAMYRRGYEAWHRRIKFDPAQAALPKSDQERRFSLPEKFQIQSRFGEDKLISYDVVFVADFRASASPDRSIFHEITAAKNAGLRTGILHLESFWKVSSREVEAFDPDLEEILIDNTIDEVLYTDESNIKFLIVRDASVLQFPPFFKSKLRVTNIIVVANVLTKDSVAAFDAGDCSNHAHRMFDVYPRWCTKANENASSIVSAISHCSLEPFFWPNQVFSMPVNMHRTVNSLNSIGRAVLNDSQDSITSWWEGIGKAPCNFKLRLLDHLNKLQESDFHGVITDPEWTPRFKFFANCAFYTDHPVVDFRDDAQLPWIMEAMAYGCVPILSPAWKPEFGEAAQYCDVDTLWETLSAFMGSPTKLKNAIAKAKSWIDIINDQTELEGLWKRFRLGSTKDA